MEKDVKLTQSEEKTLSRLLELLRVCGSWALLAAEHTHLLFSLSLPIYLHCLSALPSNNFSLRCHQSMQSERQINGALQKKKCTQSSAKEMKMKHFAYLPTDRYARTRTRTRTWTWTRTWTRSSRHIFCCCCSCCTVNARKVSYGRD